MTDISKLFQQAGFKASPFSPSSRYNGIEITALEGENDERVPYVKRRLIPPQDTFFLLKKHLVAEGERPDLLAHEYYNDAERFWQLADANLVSDANELTANPGNTIHITLPNGIPGNTNA